MNSIDRLRKVIESNNKTQAEFAESIGTTAATLSRQLNRVSKIDKQVALSIQAVYGINHEWLLTGSGSMFIDSIPEISTEAEMQEYKISDIIPEIEEIQSQINLPELKQISVTNDELQLIKLFRDHGYRGISLFCKKIFNS